VSSTAECACVCILITSKNEVFHIESVAPVEIVCVLYKVTSGHLGYLVVFHEVTIAVLCRPICSYWPERGLVFRNM
jgi:hypothetical protein